MRLTFDNIQVQVADQTSADTAWLFDFLSFTDGSALHRGKGKTSRFRLFNMLDFTFPTGNLGAVVRERKRLGLPIELNDTRHRPCVPRARPALGWLRWYQREAVTAAVTRGRGIIKVPTGGGKCLAPETLVLMHDSSTRAARDVTTGDLLMGPDSRPRRVLSTCEGVGPRYRIIPRKGDPWECNDVHVLTLVHTTTGDVVDVSLDDYLTRSRWFRHTHKLFCTGVDFAPQPPLPVNPYFIGLWIGDGRKSLQVVELTKEDPEFVAALRDIAREWGCSVNTTPHPDRTASWRLVTPRGEPNPLLVAMRDLFPRDERGGRAPVPWLFTCSRSERLAMLAGIIDTDGHLHHGYFEIAQRPGLLSQGIAFLARSLGFRVTHRTKIVNGNPYDRWNILGPIDTIPTRISRKRAAPSTKANDSRRTGFAVKRVADAAPYCGFTLDGDGRFLLADFTVTHNTEIAIGIWRSLPCRWLFIAHRAQLMNNGAERFVKRERERLEQEIAALRQLDQQGVLEPGELEEHQSELEQLIEAAHAGRYGDSVDDVLPTDQFCFATFQGLHAALAGRGGELLRWAEGVIIDECHVQPADTFFAVTQTATNAFYRFGLSGTPLQRGDRRNVLAVGALGKIVYKIRAKTLIDEGTIAYPIMRFVKHDNSHDAPKASKCTKCDGEGEVMDDILDEKVDCHACDGSGFAKIKWKTVYKHMIIGSTTRNRLCVEIAKQQAKPGICFVESVDHGKILKKLFETAGITTRFVYGSRSSTKQRDAALHDLARGHIDLLITTRIMQEGIDVPSIASVFNVASGKSPIAILQKLGRAGRVTKTKREMEFWDIYDVGHRNLRRQANSRRDAMATETECPVETIEDSRQLALIGAR